MDGEIFYSLTEAQILIDPTRRSVIGHRLPGYQKEIQLKMAETKLRQPEVE